MHNHMSPSLLVILGGDTELANAPGSDATFRMESDNDHEHQMDIVGKGPCIPVLSSLKSWYFQAFNYNKNPRHPGILLEVDGTAWQPHHASHCPAVSGGAIGDLVTTMMRDREIGIGAEAGLMVPLGL